MKESLKSAPRNWSRNGDWEFEISFPEEMKVIKTLFSSKRWTLEVRKNHARQIHLPKQVRSNPGMKKRNHEIFGVFQRKSGDETLKNKDFSKKKKFFENIF